MVLVRAVPITERMITYPMEVVEFWIKSNWKKSVNHKMILAGIINRTKLPVVRVKAFRLFRCFLIIFTLNAYPIEAMNINRAYV